ncbi:hypothetical protein SPRG_06502 [Saprolegnia parasitica CBS 223.65]|uniref:Helicase ATP-binding domain-containing protein n=1 Tax=Saprolegnia parasitica (strain CBS 223.65) TaxID=695850 RepID=A0A067CDT3_SAPPC|nr:hypothetical protein SPRG_06502 [Saprolegnia parasitica CBS 223.65]KDO28648.1 hypothetical protein SPRG_06502 [Saprolegnia parasitica CBS 223.65]|eukprot:XP_012200709.1 hypothetical protein SPRG_06502 [Saprolegnia parasitica CBS 223.65]
MSAPKRQKVQDDDAHPFGFPFPPYSIQESLMKELYETIDERKIGIFESPTGTGKSLSLICGTLTWLEHNTDSRGVLIEKDAAINDSDEPAWLRAYATPSAGAAHQAELKALCTKLDEIRANPTHARMKDLRLMHGGRDAPRGRKPPAAATLETDENYIVPEYLSDKETGGRDNSDDEVDDEDAGRGFDEPVDYGIVQIFYCSRTHSQLSQFMHEIKKTKFGASLRTLTLGARKSLCIHPDVRKLKTDAAMNDKCLDLIQSTSTKKKAPGCPYNKKSLQRYFRQHALAQVQDIEELHALGDQLSACAYYGARSALSAAQVIAMPYSMLLSKATRESLGIRLKDSIVIFDEAHNIADAVNATYAVLVSSQQVRSIHDRGAAVRRYEGRLKGRNVYYIKQLLNVLQSCHKFLTAKAKAKESTTTVWTITDFLFETKLDNINLFKLHQYLERSQLSQKVGPATLSCEDQPVDVAPWVPIERVLGGRRASPGGDDGRRDVHAHFATPINPVVHAGAYDRVDKRPAPATLPRGWRRQDAMPQIPPPQPRVALLGRPIGSAVGDPCWRHDAAHRPSAAPAPPRVVARPAQGLSCGHIIPPSHLTGVALSVGPTNQELDFTYQKRNLPQTMDEVGRILLNLVRIVPAGVVCFFPSYAYEQQIVGHWTANGQLAALEQKKRIFREPKSAADVDGVLTAYAAACHDAGTSISELCVGGLLFSVVGGKMSEGINFSDDLARCVVMVGLPYPNPHDAELLEQMKYMEASGAKLTSHEFYSNMCMKAVNQSIGRSIRHQKDYASIVLLDRRYNTPIIRSRLPQWINDRTQAFASFGPALPHLVRFFKQHEA